MNTLKRMGLGLAVALAIVAGTFAVETRGDLKAGEMYPVAIACKSVEALAAISQAARLSGPDANQVVGMMFMFGQCAPAGNAPSIVVKRLDKFRDFAGNKVETWTLPNDLFGLFFPEQIKKLTPDA